MSEDTENRSPKARDFDPRAALARVTGGDSTAFTSHLHRVAEAYARAPADHLSFQEMQAIVRGDPEALTEHAGHLANCAFCADLRETIAMPDTNREVLRDLIERYERPESSAEETPSEHLPARPRGIPTWRVRQPAKSGIAEWGFALAATLVLGVGAGILGTRHYDRAFADPTTAFLGDSGFSTWKFAVAPGSDWSHVRESCKAETHEAQSCDLLVDAAQLQARGKSQSAQPLLVSALRKSGVTQAVVTNVDGALETRPAKDANERAQAVNQARAVRAKTKTESPTPDDWLQIAKLNFTAGQPLEGFESLTSYVASDDAAAANALRVGFVEPVTMLAYHGKRTGTFSGANASSMASVEDSGH
jgi:hypothetical protein